MCFGKAIKKDGRQIGFFAEKDNFFIYFGVNFHPIKYHRNEEIELFHSDRYPVYLPFYPFKQELSMERKRRGSEGEAKSSFFKLIFVILLLWMI